MGTVNLDDGAGPITVGGTTGDAFTVTPSGTNTAAVQVTGFFPVLNTTTTTGADH